MGKIVYCPKCASFWCVETDGDSKCPKCSETFVSTGVSKEEWDTYSQLKKDETKRSFLERNGYPVLSAQAMSDRQAVAGGFDRTNNGISGIDVTLSEMNSSLKLIAKDFHFFKTVTKVMLIALGVILAIELIVMIATLA